MVHILVVDDEPKHRKCLAEMIKVIRAGYDVTEARNGNEALQIVKSRKTDIIITDIRMPIMDGLAFMEALQDMARDMKIIILSGFAYFEYAQKALSLGAFDYMLKPVNRQKITAMLEKVEKAMEMDYTEQQVKETMQKQLNTALPVYVDHLMNEWVGGFLNNDELQQIDKIFPFKGNGLVIATEISNLPDALKDYSSEEIYETRLNIKQWLKEALNPIGHTLSFFLESARNTMITIANASTRCNLASEENAGILVGFIRDMKNSYGFDVRIGVGMEHGDIFNDVGQAFRESMQALRYSPTNSETGILYFSGHSDRPAPELLPEQKEAAGDPRGLKTGKNEKIIRICEQYIHDHYMEDIPLECVAEKFHFNPSYFSSFFKNNTGMNFSNYLQKVRLEKARELLLQHTLKIYEVAQKTGYRNVKYFNRVFKHEFGVSPDEYRRTNQYT